MAEAISLDLLRVIHIQTIFTIPHVQIRNLITAYLQSPVDTSFWF